MNSVIRNLARGSYLGNSCIRQRVNSRPTTIATTIPQQLPQTHQEFQARFKSKYISKSAKKRIPLTTKRAGKGYYKGNGATKEGRLTSKGRFISDPLKKLELVVPDLEGFKLKAYIARSASKIPPELRKRPGQM